MFATPSALRTRTTLRRRSARCSSSAAVAARAIAENNMNNARTTSRRSRANRRVHQFRSRGRVRPRRLGLSKVVVFNATYETVGAKKDGKYFAAALSAFGEDLTVHSPTPTQNSNFFTGKPFVEGLGHAFLMRNYRAGLAKWQTADPMGYPDGWNQLAYCGNGVTSAVDLWGCEIVILGEVDWCGLHLATVWADCNHNYNNPSFVIKVGKLICDPLQKIDGTPNYIYDSYSFSINDISYKVDNISFEKSSATPDKKSDPFNCHVKWEYQIKLTVTSSWKETQTITDPTDPENKISDVVPKSMTHAVRQKIEEGDHAIPE